ncbi:hypothetical protein L5179_004562 [Vibrio parahaemolyticus]|nr:hypothetical protein [Vibrio parahaemolyticus]EGR2181152.1 hypothetical protein [Vibrio parahaemolyticus]EHR0803236.1 hypothetical protein [Vibrio parahaemolyticus]EIU6761684.1 hypothetical protein [Vibrio parahaemolyticus]EJG1294716.1 hypothetical protein [Vibrio parahaemolyticus]
MWKLKKNQFKNWSVPSQAGYLGFWVGAAGTVFGAIGIGLAIYFYINPPESAPTNCDRFVQSQNPTIVELEEISTSSWRGDFGDFLTFEFKNFSEVPAKNFMVNLSIDGTDIPADYPKEYKDIDLSKIAIKGGKSVQFPLTPTHALESRLQINICGYGKDAIDLDTPAPESCRYLKGVSNIRMTVHYKYETLFNERVSKDLTFWAYGWK